VRARHSNPDQNLKRLNHKIERQPNHNNRDRNPERSSHSIHSHNTRMRQNNLTLDRENLKRGGKENKIESRMAKILVYHEKSGIIKAREN
jgi:hypothetical protein